MRAAAAVVQAGGHCRSAAPVHLDDHGQDEALVHVGREHVDAGVGVAEVIALPRDTIPPSRLQGIAPLGHLQHKAAGELRALVHIDHDLRSADIQRHRENASVIHPWTHRPDGPAEERKLPFVAMTNGLVELADGREQTARAGVGHGHRLGRFAVEVQRTMRGHGVHLRGPSRACEAHSLQV
jgi:hypothetical protein